jgi:hypothetical protein
LLDRPRNVNYGSCETDQDSLQLFV